MPWAVAVGSASRLCSCAACFKHRRERVTGIDSNNERPKQLQGRRPNSEVERTAEVGYCGRSADKLHSPPAITHARNCRCNVWMPAAGPLHRPVNVLSHTACLFSHSCRLLVVVDRPTVRVTRVLSVDADVGRRALQEGEVSTTSLRTTGGLSGRQTPPERALDGGSWAPSSCCFD